MQHLARSWEDDGNVMLCAGSSPSATDRCNGDIRCAYSPFPVISLLGRNRPVNVVASRVPTFGYVIHRLYASEAHAPRDVTRAGARSPPTSLRACAAAGTRRTS